MVTDETPGLDVQMAEPRASADEEASAASIRVEDLLEDLRQGNKIHTSAIRAREIAVAEDLLLQLDAAVESNDDDWIFKLGSEASYLHNIVAWQQEAALIEWAEQYAEVLDALRAVTDGVPPRSDDLGLRFLLWPPLQAWLRAHQKRPVDPEVLQDYAALMAGPVLISTGRTITRTGRHQLVPLRPRLLTRRSSREAPASGVLPRLSAICMFPLELCVRRAVDQRPAM